MRSSAFSFIALLLLCDGAFADVFFDRHRYQRLSGAVIDTQSYPTLFEACKGAEGKWWDWETTRNIRVEYTAWADDTQSCRAYLDNDTSVLLTATSGTIGCPDDHTFDYKITHECVDDGDDDPLFALTLVFFGFTMSFAGAAIGLKAGA